MSESNREAYLRSCAAMRSWSRQSACRSSRTTSSRSSPMTTIWTRPTRWRRSWSNAAAIQ